MTDLMSGFYLCVYVMILCGCYLLSGTLCRKKEGTEPVVVGSESAPEITKHRFYEVTSDVDFTAASQRSQVYNDDDDDDVTTTSSAANGG